MKKITITAVIILTIILSTIVPFFLTSAEEMEWQKVEYQDPFDKISKEIYFLNLGKCSCLLIPLKNERELRVYVKDYYYGSGMLSQTIVIDSTEHTIAKSSFEVKDDKIFPLDKPDAHDIFREKFLPHAGKLPPEIRVKFDGHWGIK